MYYILHHGIDNMNHGYKQSFLLDYQNFAIDEPLAL